MKIRRKFPVPVAFLSALLIFVACSDDADSPYPDPVGFSLSLEGADIVVYSDGAYLFNAELFPEYVHGNELMLSTTHNEGNLTSTSAETDSPRYFTPALTINFHDVNGNRIQYPEELIDGEINPEGEYRLNWTWIDDEEGRPANLEQHGSDGSWSFHLRADYAGETGIIFRVDRCEGDRELVVEEGENHRRNQVRECSVAEETIFEADTQLPIRVDDYENAVDGRYPHNRHERKR